LELTQDGVIHIPANAIKLFQLVDGQTKIYGAWELQLIVKAPSGDEFIIESIDATFGDPKGPIKVSSPKQSFGREAVIWMMPKTLVPFRVYGTPAQARTIQAESYLTESPYDYDEALAKNSKNYASIQITKQFPPRNGESQVTEGNFVFPAKVFMVRAKAMNVNALQVDISELKLNVVLRSKTVKMEDDWWSRKKTSVHCEFYGSSCATILPLEIFAPAKNVNPIVLILNK
jgi:hypothetical protein